MYLYLKTIVDLIRCMWYGPKSSEQTMKDSGLFTPNFSQKRPVEKSVTRGKYTEGATFS